jgi:hypothetical protein
MENNNLTFGYTRVVNGDFISYSVVMVLGDKFELLPFGAATMEDLKGMIDSISNSFDKNPLIMDIHFNSDGTKIDKIETTENPMYVKKEE